MNDLLERANSASMGLSNLNMDDDSDLMDELIARIEELEEENATLKNFEHERIYASPERWNQLHNYEWQNRELKASISKAIGIYSAIEPSNPATAQAVNILKTALKYE